MTTNQLKEIIKEVEGMKISSKKIYETTVSKGALGMISYNQALDKVITLLKKYENKIEKIKYMKCDCCGKRKPDVCYRPNPYGQDVGNDPDAYWTACDYCNEQSALDI